MIVSSYTGVEFCGETGPGFKKHVDLEKSTLTLREPKRNEVSVQVPAA